MIRTLSSVLQDVFDIKASEVTQELTREYISSWDSLTQMDLVSSLESNFEIELEIEDIVKMDSVKSILEVLNSKGISFEF
jgi:acyl carrier protein